MHRKSRTLWTNGSILRDLRQRDFDCFLELRISPGNHVSGCDLDVEVRSDAGVFNAPRRSTRIVRGPIRQPDLPTIDQRGGEIVRANPGAESPLADNWTNLRKLEHE